jgi:hypothetical protein
MAARVRLSMFGEILHCDLRKAGRHRQGGQRYTAADNDLLLQNSLHLDKLVSS